MSLNNPVTPPGIDPGTVRLVAQRLNHYAIPGSLFIMYKIYRTREELNGVGVYREFNNELLLERCDQKVLLGIGM
jgi:hypothetical protein